MKGLLGLAAGGLLVVAAHAAADESRPDANMATSPTPVPAPAQAGTGDWTRPLGDAEAMRPRATVPAPAAPADMEIDVVDAHWMALTMWGEARGQGEEGMRAVGHVIHNRARMKARYGAYVTDTVSQAWQFSCWNEGDPNRAKMLDIDLLDPAGEEHRQWRAARRIAAEILSGRSADPTGGALFYHTVGVAPAWSHGVAPVARIGSHLFFRTAR